MLDRASELFIKFAYYEQALWFYSGDLQFIVWICYLSSPDDMYKIEPRLYNQWSIRYPLSSVLHLFPVCAVVKFLLVMIGLRSIFLLNLYLLCPIWLLDSMNLAWFHGFASGILAKQKGSETVSHDTVLGYAKVSILEINKKEGVSLSEVN